jgi:hypothetical protein
VRLDAEDRCCLVDPGSERLRRGSEPPRQPGRIEHAHACFLPDTAEVRGRVDFRSDGLAVEPLHLVPEAPQLLHVLLEVGHLVLAGRDVEDADGLVARVDPELVDRGDDPGEVVAPELLEALHLLRKA